MTIDEFRKLSVGFKRANSISILEKPDNYNWEEKICITFEYPCWSVFYVERGNKYELKYFAVEDDAVDYLIDLANRNDLI